MFASVKRELHIGEKKGRKKIASTKVKQYTKEENLPRASDEIRVV